MAGRGGSETLQELLDAAYAVVSERGANQLTLDGVVKRVGVSKGAILHYFPTKAELVERLTQDAIDAFDREVAEERGEDTAPGSYTRAYLEVTFRVADVIAETRSLSAMAELARDQHGNPVFTQAAKVWTEALENDGLAPGHAQLLRMAADGLMFYETGGFGLDSTTREQLVALLRHMAGGGAAPTPTNLANPD